MAVGVEGAASPEVGDEAFDNAPEGDPLPVGQAFVLAPEPVGRFKGGRPGRLQRSEEVLAAVGSLRAAGREVL